MSEFVTVDTAQGRLRGKRKVSSSSGVTYCSFQGIPYAKPPIGPLRFKPPEDPAPWSGIRDATSEGPVCLQKSWRTKETEGSEDCLFLNVYTPQWPVVPPKPVMVWVHGGKFMFGSGNTQFFGPDFLVAEDVIVVTMNYRLSALGFLYLEGTDVTGNNGLRDQVMALNWVKKNISKFGGDQGNVTIFGESAGGASVHYLMLSPLAAGLFHRAIVQSGTVFIGGCNVPVGVANQRARRLAEVLGCSSDDPQEIVNFLRTVPAEALVGSRETPSTGEELSEALTAGFFPSYEAGSNAFLPDSPRNLLESGRFTKVPFITGVTSAEGKVALFFPSSRTKLSERYKDFVKALPMELAENADPEKRREIVNTMKNFYFRNKFPCEETILQFIDMISDLEFVFPMYETVKQQRLWSPHPTYVYLFDHKTAPGFATMLTSVDDLPGAAHGSDVEYLFQGSGKRSFLPGSPDSEVRSRMVKMWTQFAKTGNPSDSIADGTWTPTTRESFKYLRINGGFTMETDLFKRRMKFLEGLYNNFLPRKILQPTPELTAASQ